MPSPARTLIVTNLYPSRREPTRGMYNYHGFRALHHRRDLRLVIPLPCWTRVKRPGELLTPPQEDQTGIQAALPTYWSLPKVGTPYNGQAVYRAIRPTANRLHREAPFTSVLSSWAYPDAVAAAKLAREWGVPHVSMALGSDINYISALPALRKQVQWALGQADHVLAVSHALGERLRELGLTAEQVVVQHNGVEGDRFRIRSAAEERQKLGLPTDRPILLYVGNWVPEKGVDLLIEAMAQVRQLGRSDALLAMVGSGALDPALRARVAELKLEEQVRFCGRQPHATIPDWMAAADLFCLPSRREGCPNVVLEALASGRPVVAARVGGLPELLRADGSNGIMVAPENPVALAEGLVEALGREWDPEALRESVPSLSWQAFGDTLDRLLSQAEARRGK